MAPVALQTRILWLLCLEPPPGPLLPTFSYQYPAPHPCSPQPPPYHELSSYTYGGGSANSQHSEGKLPTNPHIAGSGCEGQGKAKEQRLEQGLGGRRTWSVAQLLLSLSPQGAGQWVDTK